ncbi:MOSC domain-containing protein [Oceanobacter sp. 4_MG-2023]|uniref:MOSC domain-containing protein n=1 Tax=Oceanobacter sp. 4_MG-2023 TaxID=3062623 RepID=UPI0027351070|nr:MOSC N-terminal beta barrel domain-containing protein [Oceanobacter sp. 4_MG-2023]MDP2548846.1 MOSC N-terminal beta barrel domain-containing protein [Oceanobacter sp. 4_MG-2023]
MTAQTIEIADLYLYPVKSCAGYRVDRLTFDHQGPVGDRRYMIVDPEGEFLTQRRLPVMASIQTRLQQGVLTLGMDGMEDLVVDPPGASSRQLTVSVWSDKAEALDCGDLAANWLTEVLGKPARLVFMPPESHRQVDRECASVGQWVGFADGFPLLVTCEESLATLSQSAGLDIDMLRFRPNVVVRGGEAFAEQQWRALTHDEGQLLLVKPCERCVIPTRDLLTQQRQPDVVAALKQHCLIDRRLIFGQNALVERIKVLAVGDSLAVVVA